MFMFSFRIYMRLGDVRFTRVYAGSTREVAMRWAHLEYGNQIDIIAALLIASLSRPSDAINQPQ